MNKHDSKIPEENTEKTILLVTPGKVVFIVCLTLFNCIVFYNVLHWSLQKLGMYVLYITCSLGVVYFIQFSPWAQSHLSVMEEDTKTIQFHWDNDLDLRIITIITRSLYALSFLSWIGAIFLLVNVPTEEMAMAMSGFMGQNIEKWFWGSSFVFAWKIGMALFMLSVVVEFFAGVHIIFFRNNPVRNVFVGGCKMCYEAAGKILIGASSGATFGYQFLSVMPGIEITPALQFLQKYGPLNSGYTYELGSSLPSLRNRLLSHVPGYDPLNFVDPETCILDGGLQDKWIKKNIGQVRGHCGTFALQLMQIDPKPFSRY